MMCEEFVENLFLSLTSTELTDRNGIMENEVQERHSIITMYEKVPKSRKILVQSRAPFSSTESNQSDPPIVPTFPKPSGVLVWPTSVYSSYTASPLSAFQRDAQIQANPADALGPNPINDSTDLYDERSDHSYHDYYAERKSNTSKISESSTMLSPSQPLRVHIHQTETENDSGCTQAYPGHSIEHYEKPTPTACNVSLTLSSVSNRTFGCGLSKHRMGIHKSPLTIPIPRQKNNAPVMAKNTTTTSNDQNTNSNVTNADGPAAPTRKPLLNVKRRNPLAPHTHQMAAAPPCYDSNSPQQAWNPEMKTQNKVEPPPRRKPIAWASHTGNPTNCNYSPTSSTFPNNVMDEYTLQDVDDEENTNAELNVSSNISDTSICSLSN
eukprot:NODE_3193_length_1403_cov_49.911719_g2776_i0.p1 GENE.NODE_3193_length_1403_cov_49.911719_g2776_i0~~NODE_3193_length_1403_cov_49.911719_g2776_i0.p1  ORF type:complete len:406 (+),score=92.08 NODE_3193_length_1403_cov_49.911719_g2776_i0:77-1219(+)